MDIDKAREFVRGNHRAVMATRTGDGNQPPQIQQSPVLVAVDDAGRFVVSSRETAYKTKNLRVDPWTQLCVLNDRFFGDWLYVEGRAEVVSLPEAIDPLVDYFRSINGEHDDWDDYRAAMEKEKRVAIRIGATRAGPDRAG
ncbi:MAG TPA: TIGR03618 family F420-dependent PPOX class oxidoreductase [Nocardioidaceae bacterium]|nr:TIGR03618 family F420-dependent PPOX class oxidoreductase [Nocardioidaceae bacterium]